MSNGWSFFPTKWRANETYPPKKLANDYAQRQGQELHRQPFEWDLPFLNKTHDVVKLEGEQGGHSKGDFDESYEYWELIGIV